MSARSNAPENNCWDNAGPKFETPVVSKDMAPTTQAEAVDAAREDQACFDRLGPLTRKAMLDSPVRWSAKLTIDYLAMTCRGMLPTSPRVDAMMSDMIRRQEPAIVDKIRVKDQQDLAAHDPRDAIKRIIDRAEQRSQRKGA